MNFNLDFITLIDYIGTFAFAISGIRLAAAKNFDWFGAFVVGFVTAVGGGSIRDLLIGVTPFWMVNPSYVIITGISLFVTILFRKYLVRMDNTIFIFDAIGIGLFTVVGVERGMMAGFPFWVNIILGSMTGAAGGMTRDVLINEVPLIFRKEIYALACVGGGIVYYICMLLGCSEIVTGVSAAVTVVVIRVFSAVFHISMPTLKSFDHPTEDQHPK